MYAVETGLAMKLCCWKEPMTGCLNPRNTIVETPEQIVKATEKVLDFLPPEKIWLNPDCGFATFSKRPLNSYEIIKQKMSSMVEASHILRERYCK